MDKFSAALGGVAIVELRDVLSGECVSIPSGAVRPLDLPSSNVLQFVLADSSFISARPSCTEPKIKFYFSLATEYKEAHDYDSITGGMQERIAAIKADLGL